MIAGLPLGAWILLFLAVGLGLSLELVAYRRSRKRRPTAGETPPLQGPPHRSPQGPPGPGRSPDRGRS